MGTLRTRRRRRDNHVPPTSVGSGDTYDPEMVPTRGRGVLSAALLGAGLILMIGPPLLRDGICGISGCADQSPDVAVTRSDASTVVILVPEPAAPAVRSVRLLEGGSSGGSQAWLIRREGDGGASPDSFVAGEAPEGFRTVTELDAPPDEGGWVAEVGFSCTSASLPFSPESLEVGEVRSWTGVTDGTAFTDAARTGERCGGERSTVERVLFWLGAASAVAGAVLGIVVVLSRSEEDDEDDAWDDESR